MSFSPELIRFLCSPSGRANQLDAKLCDDAPASLRPAFFPIEAAIRAGVPSKIEQVLEARKPIPVGFLAEQTRLLATYGFSAEVAAATVALMLAHSVSTQFWPDGEDGEVFGPIEIDYDPFKDVQTFGQYLIQAFDCLLCNLCGAIAEDAALWLLGIAAATGDQKAIQLKEALDLAAENDEQSIRQLVSRGYAAWATYVRPTLIDSSIYHAESLGLTYQLMCRLENDSAVRLRLGLLLWEFGHAGDEDKGMRMIISSALAGNKGAWLTIRDSWDSGDNSLVEALLDEGAATAILADIDPNADNASDS